MSTTVTLRPNETFNGGSWTVTGGPTTVHEATADDLDSTYAAGPDGSTPAYVGFQNMVGFPPGARITSVTVRVRWSGDNAAMGAVATVDNLAGGVQKPHTAFHVVPVATATLQFAAMTVRPNGGPWSVDAVNSLTVRIAGNTPAVEFAAVYLDVTYSQRSTVTAVTPTGTVDDQQPTIGWTTSNPDHSPQQRWHVRLFADAVTRSGGFSPESSPAVADSGTAYQTAPNATSWTVPTPLSPGVYHPHVRVMDTGSLAWSDWASSTFTVVGDPPAPPALLSVTPDPARGCVEIRVRQSDNLLGQRTATGDGDSREYLRWYTYGNVTTPTVVTGGITGNQISCDVVADGEAAVTGLTRLTVVPGAVHVWAGWIKSDRTGGAVHLDALWFDQSASLLRMDEGGHVGLTTTRQPSEGSATPPAGATGVYLMWRSAGNLAAGQELSWDDTGIWPSRQPEDIDADLAALEALVRAAEDALVDHEIRIAALEGTTPGVTVQPTQAALDATAYRGGLDSSNLLGPANATFIHTLAGSDWTLDGDGDPSTAPDPEAFDGYSLHVSPGTVGGTRTLRLDTTVPIPQPTARYQFSLRQRAVGTGLTADPYLVWTDDDGAQVGAPVGIGRTSLAAGPLFSSAAHVSATPPAGATRFTLRMELDGDTAETDRWILDRFQVVRLPLVPPDLGFGLGPFGLGPFGGVTTVREPVVAFKPASQCDVWPLVEWSADGGGSWTAVRLTERAAYDPTTRIARVRDFEAPLGVPVIYRARTAVRDYQTDPVSGTLIVSAPTDVRQATLAADGYHVVDPYTQIRLPFALTGSPPELDMNIERPQGVFSPHGRDHRIVLSDVQKGREFSWRIALRDAAAWDAMEAMLATGHTLLVTTPLPGRWWYVRPGSAQQANAVLEGDEDHGAVIEFSGYEQARPA